jgi:hypothetical protein
MVYEVIGWAGTILILLAYLLVSIGKLSAKSKEYQFLNLFGAVGLIINTVVHRALPSAGLNTIWLLIAIYGLARAFRK